MAFSIYKIYSEIKKLSSRAKYLLSSGSADENDVAYLKKRFKTLKSNTPISFREPELNLRLKALEKLINRVKCQVCSSVVLSLQNFLNTDTTNYPVGVFNVDGDYVGIANDQTEYLTLWNGDLANQTQGTLEAGSTPLSFKLPATATITSVTGLRFYTYTGPANLQIFCGDNDIVHYGTTIKKGNVDGISISTDTRREWNRFLFAGGAHKNKIPVDTVRTLNCTGYTDSSPLYVFHNEDSKYAAVSFSNGLYTIAGQYPKALKAVFYAGRLVTNYNLITNWTELTSLFSWYNFSVGGGVWGFTPANYPTSILGNILTQIGLGQVPGGTNFNSSFSQITNANYPNIVNFFAGTNGGDLLTGSESWFLTMPKVTDTFLYEGPVVTSTVADNVWNNIWTAMNGVVPTGVTKQIRINGTINVTAASLTARNNLIAAGWTVVTT